MRVFVSGILYDIASEYSGNVTISDGNLLKKINPNNCRTLYVGGIYEVDKASGGSVTRTVTYYPVAGAMRIDSTLYYVLKDHLSSASVITNASGIEVGAQRYYPFGETRLTTGTIYTDKLYTGQREMAGLGIYHYQARFYSPKLGRFLSPDSIVPSYANPQHLNRFGYVTNNPLRYTDPSGNVPIDCLGGDGYCEGTPAPAPVSLPIPIPIPGPEFPTEPIPFIDLGPILIPPITLPDHGEEPLECIAFRNKYSRLSNQVRGIIQQIDDLLDEAEGTDEPERKEEIAQEVKRLTEERDKLLEEMGNLLVYGQALGCDINNW